MPYSFVACFDYLPLVHLILLISISASEQSFTYIQLVFFPSLRNLALIFQWRGFKYQIIEKGAVVGLRDKRISWDELSEVHPSGVLFHPFTVHLLTCSPLQTSVCVTMEWSQARKLHSAFVIIGSSQHLTPSPRLPTLSDRSPVQGSSEEIQPFCPFHLSGFPLRSAGVF